mgnify:CR=1 FL=1
MPIEPVKYCPCGNIKEYDGNWQITNKKFKKAVGNLIAAKSITSNDMCPICAVIDAMRTAKVALEAI